MDRLPPEIKTAIAKWASDDKPSLSALSEVNSEWNAIAAPVLYRHLMIRLKRNETLRALPDTLRALKHVRSLGIVSEYLNHRSEECYGKFVDVLNADYIGDEPVPSIGWIERPNWNPIIDLVRQLPALHDIQILSGNGGPEELLQALSKHQPKVRLSLFIEWSYAFYVLPKAWLASPLLYALHITCFTIRNRPTFLEHPDRILRDIAMVAPGIKQIALQINPCLLTRRMRPQRTWDETVELPTQDTSERRRLESISWPLNARMTARKFEKWHETTDFRYLKSWTVGSVEDSTPLQAIAAFPFQKLKRLSLALFQPNKNKLEFWSNAVSMFEALPPLEHLCILGSYQPNFLNQVLRRHGPTLLELKLHKGSQRWREEDVRSLARKGQIGPIFPSHDIEQLAAQCPSLQKLQICVQRRRGFETDAYAAIGRFPSLEKLDLALVCVPETGPDGMPVPSRVLNEFETQIRIHLAHLVFSRLYDQQRH